MTGEQTVVSIRRASRLLCGLYHGFRGPESVDRLSRDRAGNGPAPHCAFVLAVALALAIVPGCGRGRDHARASSGASGVAAATDAAGARGTAAGVPAPTRSLRPDVASDTGRALPLPLAAPAPAVARAWLSHVRLAREAPVAITPGPAASPPAPEPQPAQLPDTGASGTWPDALLAPVLRTRAALDVPPGATAGLASVDLDVHVDESGSVDQVRWSGGSGDRRLVDAAARCARAMRFFPAERAGRPVAVWCTQRFEFGGH